MKNSGFTLIEILIVLVIMSLFMIVGIASYRDYAQRQKIENAYRQVISDLVSAQKDAMSGRKPKGFSPGDCLGNLNGYIFKIVSADKYRIMVDCESPASPIVLREKEMPAGISIELASGGSGFSFLPLARGIDSSQTIVIESVDGQQRNISVYESGRIE